MLTNAQGESPSESTTDLLKAEMESERDITNPTHSYCSTKYSILQVQNNSYI